MTVKYIQIAVSDQLHLKLKKKCVDERVAMNQKLLEIIERELQLGGE